MERQNKIAQLVRQKGFVRVDELCSLFEVSQATMRRDLTQLEEKGELQRVSGGAIPAPSPDAMVQDSALIRAKQSIAAAAVSLVSPGDTIFLDSGTTNLEVARQLTKCQNITVITNCIKIAYLFDQNQNTNSVYICGGNIGDGSTSDSIVGPVAELMISQFRANLFFMGASSVHDTYGVTDPYLMASSLKQKMMQHAMKTILVVDHSKFGEIHKAYVCNLKDVHTVITDAQISRQYIQALQKEAVELIVVD